MSILSENGYKELSNQLITDEGEILKVYRCPAGYLTIGVGRNLETNSLTKHEVDHLQLGVYSVQEIIGVLKTRGITVEESRWLLSNDIDVCLDSLNRNLSFFENLPENVKIVLANMRFNLGMNKLLKFKNTLQFIEQGNYEKASVEMLNSSWAKQVGDRAIRLSEKIKTT